VSQSALADLPIVGDRRWLAASMAAVTIFASGGCAGFGSRGTPGSFASVRPVLEANCVHCHGTNRLAHMPPFTDTRALAGLIGPANWIIPSHPERSRFFQVVTLSDAQPGAMPPTGHAIRQRDIERLRAWIAAGAPVPDGDAVTLTPRGEGPRSR
jgi:mono/diheme cytochrome c family protein